MEKYIVEKIILFGNVAKYLEEYINWAENKGFKLMFFDALSSEALCFFKRYDIVDINLLRPSQEEFDKWRKNER